MNIEGIMYLSGDMYLGLKKPLRDNKAVILKIKDIDRAFTDGRLARTSVSIWKEFDLSDNATGKLSGISDLYLLGGSLYILGCEKKQEDTEQVKASVLWKYDMTSDRLTRLARFENLKAEGLAWNPVINKFAVVCDHGPDEPSKIFFAGVPR